MSFASRFGTSFLAPFKKSRRFLSLYILIAIPLIYNCASDYTARTKSALRNFQNGNFEKALKGYEKQKKKKKDRLLYLIDKGIVLHTAGKYEESIKILQEADDYSEKIDYFQD